MLEEIADVDFVWLLRQLYPRLNNKGWHCIMYRHFFNISLSL